MANANGHGGKRRGAGKPMGARNLRSYGKLTEINAELAGIVPVKFEGDSLDFLRATMTGKIWPSREQIYAARAMLPIEHPAPPYANGMTVEEIERAAIERFQQENAGEDVTEALIRQLDALRATQTMLDRVQATFALEPRDRPYSEEQAAAIEEILAIVDEHWPREARSEVLPPLERPPAFRKVEPVTIDATAEDISAADDGISMVYGVEAQSTHTDTHIRDAGKPVQRSLWDDPAAAFGDRGTAANGEFNPAQERMQVTRRPGGGVAYLVNGKLRE